jgi:hypothetical protein
MSRIPGSPRSERPLPPSGHPRSPKPDTHHDNVSHAPEVDAPPDATDSPPSSPELQALKRQMTHLRLAVGGLALLILAGVATGAVGISPTDEVIRAERLEIVEPDGSLAFVLANSARPAPATIDGELIMAGQEEERRNPSFIFFDGQGDEVGGMLFSNTTSDDGFRASRHLSLDGYKQDQTVVLHHYQDSRGSASGLSVSDRPEDLSILDALRALGLEPGASRQELQSAMMEIPEEERGARLATLFGGAQRVFVGTARSREATVLLSDGQGRPRIHLGVPDDGEPFIRILNESGETVMEWPGS